MDLTNRICDTSTTTGTGNLTLAGPVAGYEGFNSSGVSSVGNDFHYLIEAVDTNGVPTGAYEIGIGKNPTTTTLQRLFVLQSSNAGALVSFAAGPKRVHLIASGYQLGWRGALTYMNADLTAQNFTTAAAISWSGASPDSDGASGTLTGFWDAGAPTAITIPASGYDQTLGECFGQVGIAAATASEWIELTIKHSGSPIGKQRFLVPATSATFQIHAPIRTIGFSDIFQLFVQTQTDNSITITAADTFLQLNVRQ